MSFLSLILGLMPLSSFGDAVSGAMLKVDMETHRPDAVVEHVVFQGRSPVATSTQVAGGAMPRGDRGAPSNSRGSGSR